MIVQASPVESIPEPETSTPAPTLWRRLAKKLVAKWLDEGGRQQPPKPRYRYSMKAEPIESIEEYLAYCELGGSE